jgi:hypothetical protein
MLLQRAMREDILNEGLDGNTIYFLMFWMINYVTVATIDIGYTAQGSVWNSMLLLRALTKDIQVEVLDRTDIYYRDL